MGEVDLDRLANAYGLRPTSKASLDRAEQAGSLLLAPARILDVGGGPGNHSAVWAAQGHQPVVIDPSPGMVALARSHHIGVVAGCAQELPFRPRSFALVWFHLSIHYGDWRRALDEATRVVDDFGRVEVWTLGADHYTQSILSRWFPSVAAIDATRFPDPIEIEDYLGHLLPVVAATHPHETVVRPVGAWLEAIEAGFVSTLHLLSDSERSAGIAGIRRAYPDPAEEITYELHFTRITGDRRGGGHAPLPLDT